MLYFGCDTKSKDIQLAEKTRVLNVETTSIDNLLADAKEKLSPDAKNRIQAYEVALSQAESDSARLDYAKQLSSNWFQLNAYGLAGFYAELIAKERNDEESWSIAGTTFASGVLNGSSDKEKQYCSSRSKKAFENAISINPTSEQHKLNLAIVLAEDPPQENPMQGIMMLLDLNKKNPDNTGVLYQLARLGLKTSQFEKAEQRVLKILELEPKNRRAICLMVDIQNGLNNEAEAERFKKECIKK